MLDPDWFVLEVDLADIIVLVLHLDLLDEDVDAVRLLDDREARFG
jgi:hypothetical protein